jgi:hypothetical protein
LDLLLHGRVREREPARVPMGDGLQAVGGYRQGVRDTIQACRDGNELCKLAENKL